LGLKLGKAVLVISDLGSIRSHGSEVAEPERSELEAQIEDLSPTAAGGSLCLIIHISGGAFDSSSSLLLQRFAGRRLGVFARLLCGFE